MRVYADFLRHILMSKKLATKVATVLVAFLILFFAGMTKVSAGPPFKTDDPEPVEYRHWEVYLSAQYFHDRDGTSGTLPHLEVNYGIIPEVQLHLIAPLAYDHPKGGSTVFGYGDTEVGVKVRFLKETDRLPQIGIFPLAELPTGSERRGLGNGKTQFFLPVWLQKSWGPWTSYGGGGYWINPGEGNRDWWFFGWLLQRDLNDMFTVGAEVFHGTPSEDNGDNSTGFNVGGQINLNDIQHILYSVGRDFSGPNRLSIYLGYQLTFGP